MKSHCRYCSTFFFFNDTATTEIYTLSLHDALPIVPTPGARPGVSLSLTGLSMHSAARLDTLGTEQAYVVLAAARRLEAAGHKVVHLEIGEPDMPTPPHVVEAGGGGVGGRPPPHPPPPGGAGARGAVAPPPAARGGRPPAPNVLGP